MGTVGITLGAAEVEILETGTPGCAAERGCRPRGKGCLAYSYE